jgi:hypothetical protein
MHAWLAHAYHLARFGLHVLLHPLWRAPLAAGLAAGLGRLAGLAKSPRGAAGLACGAALVGWIVLYPGVMAMPPPPVGRLPELALILLAGLYWRATGLRGLALTATAASGAWWLRGAPLDGNGILNCMPVFLGLAAALPLARRWSGGDRGWGGVAAALALAGSLLLTGAAVHWAQAAAVVAVAALALWGVADAAGAIAGLVVMVAAATIVASDRGRLIPVDVACLAPLPAWWLAKRIPRRKPGRK